MLKKITIFLVFFCFFKTAYSNDVSSYYIEKANDLKLYQSEEWLRLLHYKKTAILGTKSIITSERFFVSKNGNKDARAEMQETIKAFFNNNLEENKKRQHALCQFPARFDYLNRHLKFSDKNLPKPECKKFKEFFNELQPHGISIIFPTTYMNNPASMFGHTLIRIDRKNSQKNNIDLNSFIVNFGANTHGETSGIIYAFKGVFGLYKGFFSVMPYYKMTNDYNNLENRDIWEYTLNYSEEEAIFFSKHLWELVFTDMRYYFFKENCSYFMLEILDVIRQDLNLTKDFLVYTAPIDTIKVFKNNKMITSEKYRPSLQKQIQNNIQFLTHKEKNFVKKIVKNEKYNPKIESKHSDLVYETAYNWLKYEKVKNNMDIGFYRRQSLKILKNVKDEEINTEYKIKELTSPDNGHKIGKAGLSFGRFKDQNYLQLNYKPCYHELTDDNRGFDSHSEISFFSFSGRYYFRDEDFELKKFDFVKIKSLAVQDSFFKPISFSVLFGIENLYENFKVLMLDVNGGLTLGNEFISTFFLVGPKINYTGRFAHDMTFGANGVIGTFLNFGYIKLITDFKINTLTDPRYNYNQLSIESNFIVDKNFEINLNFNRYFYRKFDNASDFSVGFRVLF